MTPRSLTQKFLKAARRKGETILSAPVKFPNDDVPRFLKRLDDFERRSRRHQAGILVK